MQCGVRTFSDQFQNKRANSEKISFGKVNTKNKISGGEFWKRFSSQFLKFTKYYFSSI